MRGHPATSASQRRPPPFLVPSPARHGRAAVDFVPSINRLLRRRAHRAPSHDATSTPPRSPPLR
uniref:Uncharacterized protein n=1 Tax=Arundo donax TaxID=35708 RepID=A0A0A8YEI8_ARUDO